jgi:hypothetical protein
MAVENTRTYYDRATIISVKRFIVQALVPTAAAELDSVISG